MVAIAVAVATVVVGAVVVAVVVAAGRFGGFFDATKQFSGFEEGSMQMGTFLSWLECCIFFGCVGERFGFGRVHRIIVILMCCWWLFGSIGVVGTMTPIGVDVASVVSRGSYENGIVAGQGTCLTAAAVCGVGGIGTTMPQHGCCPKNATQGMDEMVWIFLVGTDSLAPFSFYGQHSLFCG